MNAQSDDTDTSTQKPHSKFQGLFPFELETIKWKNMQR